MARTRPISISFLPATLLCVVLSTSLFAAEQPPWREIHSPHYTVITDAEDKKGIEVALRFEQMRGVFATLLMKDRLNEPVPLTILAFKNDKSYYQSAPLRQGQPIDVPGFFLPGEDQNFIVLNLAEEQSWRAVAHDFAHLLIDYNYPPVQAWFDEGLAEYFSSIRLEDKKYEIGGDPEQQSLTELLNSQPWLALPDLLSMKHDTSVYDEGTHRTMFYAQSWMVMHYLLHEQKLVQTGTYFDLVENQHMPVEPAIQKAYGVTSAQLDQAVKDYFHSLTALFVALDASKKPGTPQPPQVYQFPEIVATDASVITTKVLRETDGRALTDEVKIRIPERREAGEQELQALATAPDPAAAPAKGKEKNQDDKKNPMLVMTVGNEIAHRALAWDDLQRKEFTEAAEELGRAAALNQRDMWIRYYLCVLKYRVAQSKHAEIEGLPNMMQDLEAVVEWYPEFADAYNLLAVAHLRGGGPIAAMQAERAAMRLSPRNQQYVYNMAEIYISAKKWEAARALLERLKTSSSNPEVAAEASERLGQLANEQKYGISANAAAADRKIAAQPSPFDVLEQDAANRAAAQRAQSAGIADKRPAKFLQGRLIDVDCSQSPAAVLTVTSGGATLKLRTADYKSLLLIGADTFSCAWSNRAVSVNYKPGGMADGDLVSVEVR
jgi:tetratricopeptide (TPR) repeat protein